MPTPHRLTPGNPPIPRSRAGTLSAVLALAGLGAGATPALLPTAWAQPATPDAAAPAAPSPPPPPAPTPASEATPTPTPPASAPSQRIEITGGRISDDEQRRRSTAAKIVIGREEIDKFGDATVGEVLRRLPGVTTPGAPGRGGAPRMRGLGGGFTQLLIDGQRVPPGFSLESLTPDQIERIEILRAPTAETGARAIAGTINIITREGFRRRLNELRIGLAQEGGELTPGMFWTHNNSRDALTYTLSAGLFRPSRANQSQTETLVTGPDGTLREQLLETAESHEKRQGLNLTGRLQWRLNEQGDTLLLMPSVFHGEGRTTRDAVFSSRAVPGAPRTLPDDTQSHTEGSGHNTSARLNVHWRQRLGFGRLEVQGGAGQFESVNHSERLNQGGQQGSTLLRDDTRSLERSASVTLKYSGVLGGPTSTGGTRGTGRTSGAGGGASPAARDSSEHNLVSGLELEGVQRRETRSTLLNGQPQLADFGEQLEASSQRLAAYVQDEWSLNRHWALHGGLRWEGITTRGQATDGTRPENRSSVTTPLVHLLWKPDPNTRDQVRISLTRSYRSPALATLIARPSVNTRIPLTQTNGPTTADSAGNPALQPELASGLDVAFERYLPGGGVLSANLFYRRINNLMRRVVSLESVPWSPVPRYVARQQNVGSAVTQGLELEAKFRLDQAVTGAPPVELRSNLSVYRSRVDGVPGPDNRLDSQATLTANVGADYRFRGTPLTVGGNLNAVPAYRTQLSDAQATDTGRKRVFDAYALWTFSPTVGLRLLASNLGPLDYVSGSRYTEDGITTASQSRQATNTNWQLRLELKL